MMQKLTEFGNAIVQNIVINITKVRRIAAYRHGKIDFIYI